MKKLVCFLLSAIISINLPILVSAQNTKQDNLSNFVSKKAIAVMNIKNAPKSIIEFVKNNKVNINDESVIQLLPTTSKSTNTQTTALSILNKNGNTITNDILINPIGDNTKTTSDQTSVIAQPNGGTGVDFDTDSRFTVHGVAVYNIYYNGIYSYYSPYGSYFYYHKNTTVDVSYMSVEYICDGITYSYPGFSYLGDEVEHHVDAYAYYPNVDTMYSQTNYFDSDKVLSVSSGSPFVGNFLTLSYTADGESDSYTVSL